MINDLLAKHMRHSIKLKTTVYLLVAMTSDAKNVNMLFI